jgi:uncharacterized membrane protein YfcA
MSYKLKSTDMATPIKDDRATNLGILFGTLSGAGLVYWRLAMISQYHGMVIVLSVTVGVFIGAGIGAFLGHLIDKRFSSKVRRTILDAADYAAKHPRRGGKW